MNDKLTPEEKQRLLHIARQSLELAVRGEKLPPLDEATLTPCLHEIRRLVRDPDRARRPPRLYRRSGTLSATGNGCT